MFKLPDEWEEFYNDMSERAKQYIQIKYWDITEEDFILWLQNFQTNHEKFLGAIIIYRVIYRNINPMLSMFRYITDILIPNALSDINIEVDSLDLFHDKLQNGHDLPILFTAVENVDGQTGKSGSTIIREFARKGSFHNKLKVSAANFKNIDKEKIKMVVVLDDIMGTGEQFNTFLENYYEDLQGLVCFYTPLTATSLALESFDTTKYANVIIKPVELLDDNYNFFDKKFMPKIVDAIDTCDLKQLYENLIRKKTKLKSDLFGRKDLALTYIFSVSTPNNSLPIFSYNDRYWNKIFPR
jgi:hypothetical protein